MVKPRMCKLSLVIQQQRAGSSPQHQKTQTKYEHVLTDRSIGSSHPEHRNKTTASEQSTSRISGQLQERGFFKKKTLPPLLRWEDSKSQKGREMAQICIYMLNMPVQGEATRNLLYRLSGYKVWMCVCVCMHSRLLLGTEARALSILNLCSTNELHLKRLDSKNAQQILSKQ